MRIRSSAGSDLPGRYSPTSKDGNAVVSEADIHPMLVTAYDLDSKYAQHIRTIRSKIVQSQAVGRSVSHYALIGFDCPSELSVLAANLGVVMARLETPTLLVDAARSNAMIHELMGVPNDVGVSNLDASVSLAEIAHPTVLDQLWLVPAGPQLDQGGQAFEKEALISRLERWNVSASSILISVPIDEQTNQSAVADMVSGVDGVVLFIRRHVTKIADIHVLIDLLDERDVPVIGTVIV